MNFTKVVIAIIVLIFITMTANSENNTTRVTYVSNVDPDLGFYKVTDNTAHKSAPYTNRTLIINQEDTVIWKNDADQPKPVTIINEQGLLKDIFLKLVGDVSSYTFGQPGKYTFYIKERQTARQTIIVNAVESYSTPTVTNTETPISTPITVDTTSNTTTLTIIPTMITTPVMTSNLTLEQNITNISGTIGDGINIWNILNNYIGGLLIIITISVIGYIVAYRKFRSEDGIKYGKTDNIDQIACEWNCKRFSTKTIRIYNTDECNSMYFAIYTKIADKGDSIPDDNYFYYKLDAKTNREIIYIHEQNISSIRIEVKNCEPDKPAKYKIEYRGTRIPIIIRC